MVIVYGWRTNVKKEKQLGREHCLNCNHEEDMFLAKEIFKLHIFGIPIFKKTSRRFVMCNNCGIVEELSKTDYKARLKEI